MRITAALREKLATRMPWAPAWLIALIVALAVFATATGANVAGFGVVAIVFGVVAAIVGFLVIAGLADPFLDALGTLLTSLVNVELGSNTAANTTEIVIETMAILVGVAAAFFLVGYVIVLAGRRRGA